MEAREIIAKCIAENLDMAADEVAACLETPPDRSMGDYAFPCFRLAKSYKKAPAAIAAELAPRLRSDAFTAAVSGGYINFMLNRKAFAASVLARVLREGEGYGDSNEGGGRAVCIDYSSINIAKPFHIGHFRTTIIGHSLYRIYQKMGYNSIGINHLGDWGTQFGKLIVALKRWGDEATIEQRPMRELLKIYVRFHEEAEKDPALEDEARAWFKRIEDGDDEAKKLFLWFKELTLREVDRVYKTLGIVFDHYTGESFYNDKMDAVVDRLREKGLLELNEGAYVVNLSQWEMPPCLILKADGASLYATRDLAAAIYRKDTFDFVKSLYVVAYQQDLHFRQVFKVLELMGYDWAKDLVHVSFGMVSLEDASLSTRKGNVVFLDDMLERVCAKALSVIEEKSPGLENKEQIARQIGVGAAIFDTLSSGRIKDISFNWDRALQFDGETGPYVQYTHARACSVLNKAGMKTEAPGFEFDAEALTDDEAFELLWQIGLFQETVWEAARKYEPFIIVKYLLDVAKAFNKFYYERRIMHDDANVRDARLKLTLAARTVLRAGLRLIGLHAPEKM